MRLTRQDPEPRGSVPTNTWLPASWALIAVLAGLGGVFFLDRSTGDSPVQHLYYLPIILTAGRFGRWAGLMASLAAIVLYHVANWPVLTTHPIESDVVQIALFSIVGLGTARLVSDAQRLRVLSLTDDLTGLHNLRSFEQQLAAMVRAARVKQDALSLLVIDLDRLKALNDRHGHLTGAEAVRTVGILIAEHVPADAVACRYGGDEFVIAIPECTEVRALEVAQNLRLAVHAVAPELAGRSFPAATLSISAGAACRSFAEPAGSALVLRSDTEEGEALFRAADATSAGALVAVATAGTER